MCVLYTSRACCMCVLHVCARACCMCVLYTSCMCVLYTSALHQHSKGSGPGENLKGRRLFENRVFVEN